VRWEGERNAVCGMVGWEVFWDVPAGSRRGGTVRGTAVLWVRWTSAGAGLGDAGYELRSGLKKGRAVAC
jgi:hypothetical protein